MRQELVAIVDGIFERFDALIAPTTPILAPPLGEVDDTLELVANTALFNLTGHPALSVPVGEVNGKPVGMQLATRRYREATAIRLGAVVESATGR
jgi:Asp-tRNA(Asn)/Glu-tRNA(Gln) amidotransferase A subunit family amidase